MSRHHNTETHCNFCRCPKDTWKPLENYQSDRCCEFYDDIYNIAADLEDKHGFVSLTGLIYNSQLHKKKYLDIPYFNIAVSECYETFKDLGIFNVKKPISRPTKVVIMAY